NGLEYWNGRKIGFSHSLALCLARWERVDVVLPADLLALPECPHVLHNGLRLQETPEIAILDHALPVDQECPGRMLRSTTPLARGFTISPNACHTAWTACGGPVTNAQEARSTPRRWA